MAQLTAPCVGRPDLILDRLTMRLPTLAQSKALYLALVFRVLGYYAINYHAFDMARGVVLGGDGAAQGYKGDGLA